jgi:hypothetical protein
MGIKDDGKETSMLTLEISLRWKVNSFCTCNLGSRLTLANNGL